MRLVTRSDFDGLACAVLLKQAGVIDDYLFTHPKDLQDGKVPVTSNDVLANVPYVPGCGMWFDHHSSEQERLSAELRYEGDSRPLPSCARVIWEYYGKETFSHTLIPMIDAVDKVDSADLSARDITDPQGWILLGYIMDPRTGLGRYRDYRISNYQLMLDMIEYCGSMTDDEILDLPDVRERVQRYKAHEKPFQDMLFQNATAHRNLVVVDLRNQEPIYCGNRFVIYTLFPQCNVSARIIWGFRKQNVVFTVGHSILNRTSKTDVGSLMLRHGGGGHRAVGTCQVPEDRVQETLADIISQVNSDG